MEKLIVVEDKRTKICKLILKVDIDEEAEDLLKKRFNLLALSQKLSNKQTELLETVFGYYWYKNCEINIIKIV